MLTTHRNRLAAQRRIVALLDGRIERVHVDVDDATMHFDVRYPLTAARWARRQQSSSLRCLFSATHQHSRRCLAERTAASGQRGDPLLNHPSYRRELDRFLCVIVDLDAG